MGAHPQQARGALAAPCRHRAGRLGREPGAPLSRSGATAIPLGRIQRQLQRIYELDVPHAVDDFLITDPAVARRMDSSPAARETPEKLLVRQDGDCVDVALFIDQSILGTLERDDPSERLHGGNFAAYCTALEGVSHFLCLVWNAARDRTISRLELEMQAEVDKYVNTAFLLGHQGDGAIPARLDGLLFDNPVFDRNLAGEELERYRDANYYAGKYCYRFLKRYLRGEGGGGVLNELRRFYRLTKQGKINRIESRA